MMVRPTGSVARIARLAALGAVLWSGVACAAVPDVLQGLDGSATARQLNAPWQPTPMRPSADILAEADRVCRSDIPFAATVPLLVVDARGEGRLQLFYGSPDGQSAECNGIFVGPNGTITPGGAGGSGFGGPWPPIGVNALVVSSSGGSSGSGDSEQHRAGRAGAAVARVLVRIADRAEPIEATVDKGWWAAWWPGDARCLGLFALAPDGTELSTAPC